MNDHVRSLLRFWWVMVIGLAVSQAAAIFAVYNVDFSTMPPSLTQREQPKYSAQGRLLVTDGDEPHLRRAVEVTVQPPATAGNETPKPVQVSQAPDTATLVKAANLYPLLIESDQVAAVREDLFGPTKGELKAQAVFAISTPSRFTPSDVPVIQLIAVADSPKQAIELVSHTTTAFVRWMTDAQNKARIKPAQRITVTSIQAPKGAVSFGGSSSVLPVLVFGIMLMAFAALAVFLDRMFPRRRETLAADIVPAPERMTAAARPR